jgi:outer membrane cobalamin receptor
MKRSIVIAGLAAVSAARVHAQAAQPEEIVVLGRQIEQNLPQQLAEFGVKMDTLTRADVLNGSYVDVTQVLEAKTPGLFMLPKNGPFDYSDISMLGSRTDDVLWLVDGVRINNRLYSGTPPLDTIPGAMVERVESMQGGTSLFYGTAATAGTVNIVTKSFTDKLDASFNLATDTNSSNHIDGYYADGFGANHLVLYGSKDDSDGYRAFRPQDYQASNTDRDRGYDVTTLGVKYAYDFSPDARLSATYQHTDADLDYAQPFRIARDVNSRTETLSTVKFDYAISDNVGFYLKTYYHWWNTKYDTVYNDLQNPGQQIVLYDDAIWRYDDRGLNALFHIGGGKGLDYYVGYDYQRYGGYDEVLVIEPNKETTQAVFGQIRFTGEHSKLAFGVRYNDPDVGESATVYNVSGQLDLSDKLFLRGTAGSNFRLPTAEELFSNDPDDERGNPNLKPERSKGVNVSLGGSPGGKQGMFHWEVTAFGRDIEDLIAGCDVFDDATDQCVFSNSPSTVKVRGAALDFTGAFSENVSATLSYAHNRARTNDGPQIARVPEDVTKASLDFHPTRSGFGASIAVNYVGNVSANIGGYPTSDDVTPVSYGNYTVVDISGRYFLDQDRKQRLTLSVQNAFDEEYGRPSRGCIDNSADGPYDCSDPYIYVNLGLPRTVRFSYTHGF